MLESVRYSLFRVLKMNTIPTFFKTFALADKKIKEHRIQVCRKCENLNSLEQCDVCHCFMPVKAKFIETKCPLGKW